MNFAKTLPLINILGVSQVMRVFRYFSEDAFLSEYKLKGAVSALKGERTIGGDDLNVDEDKYYAKGHVLLYPRNEYQEVYLNLNDNNLTAASSEMLSGNFGNAYGEDRLCSMIVLFKAIKHYVDRYIMLDAVTKQNASA